MTGSSSNDQHDELIKQLRGIRRIAINSCHGGFGLSWEAKMLYLELAGLTYTLDPQPDRDTQNRFGSRIIVNDLPWGEYSITRDDPALISVVNRLGSKANGNYASIKIVEIPPDVEWFIAEYDGKEWVAEKHRTWK